MRKIWTPKIWSLGTNSGSLGPLSHKKGGLGFPQTQILVIWDPYNLPIPMACLAETKTPKIIPGVCVWEKKRD